MVDLALVYDHNSVGDPIGYVDAAYGDDTMVEGRHTVPRC